MTRSLLSLAAVISLTAFATAAKPNVIVIVGDDMGYADIGAHGCKDIPTPHIDSLATTGTRCTSGYVSGPYCSPTRAALLTGRYQQRFGHEFNPGPQAVDGEKGLSLKETTLADRMKAAGYKTGMVGKWHLGGLDKFNPVNRGFESYFGFLGGQHSYLNLKTGIVRGTKPVDEKEYLTDAFGREAVAFIDEHKKEPFFLYWTFNAVHVPLEATDTYLKRFDAIKDPKRKKYAAMMSAMDDNVGRVLKKLADERLTENTLIFFISDNGGPPANGSSNGDLHGFKATTWEGGVRVPFLVQWKGTLPEGKTYDRPVIQLDFLPTALAAAGAEVKPEWKLDGVNLLPFLKGESKDAPHAALFWRFGGQAAVRMGDWKLTKAAGPNEDVERKGPATLDGAKLFDLKDDLGEKTDLAAKNPERVNELTAAWAAWNKELVEPSWGPPRAK